MTSNDDPNIDVARLQRAVANLTHDVQALSREQAQSLLEREELSILRERYALLVRERDETRQECATARQENAALAATVEQTRRQNAELQDQLRSLNKELEKFRAWQNNLLASKSWRFAQMLGRITSKK